MVTKDEINAVLAEVNETLADESKWSKRHIAENEQGEPCAPGDKDAVRWDITGAIEKSIRGHRTGMPAIAELREAVHLALNTSRGRSDRLDVWQDQRTLAEVKAAVTGGIDVNPS